VIQFNLLPHREALRIFKQGQFKTSMFLTILLGGITAFVIYGALNSSINAQKDNITVLENEIRRYEAHMLEIKDIKTQIDGLLARQSALQGIQANRNSPVRLLIELANILPQGLVLTKVAQKDQELTLEGTAQTNENLSQLLDKLGKGSACFSKPQLLLSEVQPFNASGNMPAKAFKFSVKATFLACTEGVSAEATPSKAAAAAAPSGILH